MRLDIQPTELSSPFTKSVAYQERAKESQYSFDI